MKCTACGFDSPAGNHFCVNCGQPMPVAVAAPAVAAPAVAAPAVAAPASPAPLVQPMPLVQPAPVGNCPRCGKPVKPGARFCNVCGEQIAVVPVAQLPGQPVAAPPTPAQNPPVANGIDPSALARLRDPRMAALVAAVFTCLIAMGCSLLVLVGCRATGGGGICVNLAGAFSPPTQTPTFTPTITITLEAPIQAPTSTAVVISQTIVTESVIETATATLMPTGLVVTPTQTLPTPASLGGTNTPNPAP